MSAHTIRPTALRLAVRQAGPFACCRSSHARPFSSSPVAASGAGQLSAADAAERLLADFSGTTLIRRQVLDGNQLQKLCLTLGRRTVHPHGPDVSENAPVDGTPLPAGYHLVYFTPNGVEAELGRDGTDKTFNAPPPFTRRMWASGKMQWHAETRLRVGQTVEERTRLLQAEPKTSSSGGEMVRVQVEKEFWGPTGLALVDRRTWIFRPEVPHTLQEETKPQREAAASLADIHSTSSIEDRPTPSLEVPTRHLQWSPVGLFRFSGLTFNGHKIHYNETWAADVEAHAGLVVHGPLNVINMLDYWRDIYSAGTEHLPREFEYRASKPIYAGEPYRIGTEMVQEGLAEENMGRLTVNIGVDKGQNVSCMRGEVMATKGTWVLDLESEKKRNSG